MKFEAGLNSGKWLLIRTQPNKLEKWFFQKKPQESFHPNLYFNKFVAEKVQTQKHLGLKDNFKDNFSNVNGGMGILKKMSEFLPR